DLSGGPEGLTFHATGSVVFDPDGRLVGCAAEDGTVRVLDAVTGKEVRMVPRSGALDPFGHNPKGRRLAVEALAAEALAANSLSEEARGGEAAGPRPNSREMRDRRFVAAPIFSTDDRLAVGGAQWQGKSLLFTQLSLWDVVAGRL